MQKYLLCLLTIVLIGCGATRRDSALRPSGEGISNGGTEIVSTADSEAARVIEKFARLVSEGDVEGAASLLAPGLRGAYAFDNYAPIRNTPKMDIIKIVDYTGKWPPETDREKVAEYRVFYVEVRYKVLGIIRSYFRDGEVYHHKATVVKFTPEGPWLITELSGIGAQ